LGVEDDGVFGPKTKEALEKFQRENGLKDDGIAGEKTVKVLNKKFNIKEGSESVISEQDDQTAKDVETINKEVLGDESETVEVDSEETPEVKVTGCIKGDCENGQGTYIWSNGSIYHSGLWKDSVPVKTDETNTDGNGNEDNSEEKSTTPDTETPKDNSEEKSTTPDTETPKDNSEEKITTTDTETPKDDSEVTVKDIIKDKKEDEVSEKEKVKTNFKGCKKIITDAIKLANDGNSMEDAYKDKSDDKRLEIEGCLGKYYNSFEKIGFMKKGKGKTIVGY
jgi:hypothetical protein